MKNLTVAFMTCSAVENDAAGNACWFQTTPPYGRYPGRNQITGKDGKPIKDAVVVFDEKSVGKVVAAFKEAAKAKDWPGILVDQDHFSCNTSKPSTALAWARDIRVGEDGSIWTKWEFTAKGKELYEGKMLINRSPVLDLEQLSAKEFAPTVLTSIGMTNAPYFKDLSPLAAARNGGNMQITCVTDANGLSHGADRKFDGGNGSASKKDIEHLKTSNEVIDYFAKKWKSPKDSVEDLKSNMKSMYGNDVEKIKEVLLDWDKNPDGGDNTDTDTLDKLFGRSFRKRILAARAVNNTQGETMDPKILEKLELAEGATLDDVLAAIQALKDKEAAATATATDATKKAEDAEAKCRGLKCDAFIAAHKAQIADEAKFREAYLKAPEATEAAFGLFRTAEPPKAPAARISARDAKTPSATAGTDAAVKAKITARNNAVNAYMTAHPGCTNAAAWSACRLADPETFAD